MNQKNGYDLLYCPTDKSSLKLINGSLICKHCQKKYPIINGIVKIIPHLTSDLKLSIQKWDEFYQRELQSKAYDEEKDKYIKLHFKDVYRQINQYKHISDIVYLEIGCGPAFFLQEIAQNCKLLIGIDFCSSALKIAKLMLDKKRCKNYLLIQADILSMPIKDNVVDLIYGGGVIEHFRETQKCVNELYRVLKKKGVSFNTVPYLNLGTLTYRQIWGNIPNFPVLKQIAEFIHMKILRGKHMVFGYEMSFLRSTLKKIHEKAKFKKVVVNKFDVHLVFDFLPKQIRRPFIWLAKNIPLFWPMVKVVGTK